MSDGMFALITVGPAALVMLIVIFGRRAFAQWRAKDLAIRERQKIKRTADND